MCSSHWETCLFLGYMFKCVWERETERANWHIWVITRDWMCQVISTSVKEGRGRETGNLMSEAASELISGGGGG